MVEGRPAGLLLMVMATTGAGAQSLDLSKIHRQQRTLVIGIHTYGGGCAAYVCCRTGGRPEGPITLAWPSARCTRRLDAHLFRLPGDSTLKAVAARMDVDWRTVRDAEVRYVRGLLRTRNLGGITRIGIPALRAEG